MPSGLALDLLRVSGIIPGPQVEGEFPSVLTQVTQNLERLHRQGQLSDAALFIFGFSMMWKALEDLPPARRAEKFIEMATLFAQQEGVGHGQGQPAAADGGGGGAQKEGGDRQDNAEQRELGDRRATGDKTV